MRPDSCYRVDQHPRRAVELAIPLAGNGRRGSGGDQGDTTFRVRAGVRHAGVPARQPRLGGRGRVTVVHPDGQWQLQAQVLHWRGDTARGGQIAASVFGTAVAALRACQLGAPLQSPSVTDDEPTRMAAVISGPVIMYTYLVAHVSSSTISELTLWSSGPPQVPWPTVADSAVLDALTAPLCEAYIGSCP